MRRSRRLVNSAHPAERTDYRPALARFSIAWKKSSLNAALMREMRVIAMITQMIDDGRLSGTKRMFFHLVEAEDITRDLSASSKMNFDWNFLMHLLRWAAPEQKSGSPTTSNFSASRQHSTCIQGIYSSNVTYSCFQT
jgi:hypothetical protein